MRFLETPVQGSELHCGVIAELHCGVVNFPLYSDQVTRQSEVVMSEEIAGFWTDEARAVELSKSEKELRDKFVAEYLVDFDQLAAAIRIGFSVTFAATYAERFMQEPYTRQRISEMQLALADDVSAEAERDRRIIRAALMREAHHRGQGSSHAARVSALAKLASIRDMDAPLKIKSEQTLRGGVMLVPAIASIEDWEAAARASQTNLQKDSNIG